MSSMYTRLSEKDSDFNSPRPDTLSRISIEKGKQSVRISLETAGTPSPRELSLINPPKRYIKLLGSPNCPPSVCHPSNPLSTKPSEDTTAEEVIAVIDVENEDPFTLEPFSSLIKLHAERGKDFIICRVTTVDPHDDAKFYYSYYAAHHINKVIFRTQPEEGLLHRMKAKNPLNNMTIVGDVHYYSISAADIPLPPRKSTDSFFSILSTGSPSSPNAPSYRHLDLAANRSPGTQRGEKKRPSSALAQLEKGSNSISTSPTSSNFSSAIPSMSKLLEYAGLKQKTPKRTLKLVMKPEAIEEGQSKVTASQKSPSKLDTKTRSILRRNSVDSALSAKPPTFPNASVHFSQSSSTGVRAEAATPNLSRRHGYGGEKKKSSKTKSSKKNKTLKRKSSEQDLESAALSSSPSSSEASSGSPAGSPTSFYVASYYGTDDDFLMKASVRAYFKQNALEDGDALLFSIPSSATDGSAAADQGLLPHPTLPQFLFAVQDEVSNGIEEDLYDIIRKLRERGRWRWYALAYSVAGVVFCKWVVPEAYSLLSAFLFIFTLCLFLLLCL